MHQQVRSHRLDRSRRLRIGFVARSLLVRSLLVQSLLVLGLAQPSNAASTFDPAVLRTHVATLAADEMEGRGVGAAGIERAAEYIAKQFADAGLQPAGDGGTYFQSFRVTAGVRMVGDNRLRIGAAELRLDRDFVPVNFSANGAVRGSLVFAGYGITAPEIGYDDYANLDAAGKIVLVFTREPREHDQQSPFRDPGAFRYTELRYKLHNARQHGARGVLVVDAPDAGEAVPAALRFETTNAGASAGILAAFLHPSAADRLLKNSGSTASNFKEKIDASFKPASFDLPGVAVVFAVSLEKVFGTARNVVGRIAGADAARSGEAVVIGAHYDHLGYGDITSLAEGAGKQIHNGADDNASGTAGVIALAKAFATRGGAPRTLIFTAFSAEELGILGSTYFVKHLPSPPSRIQNVVAMVNLDMIGRLRERTLHVQGIGTASGFRALMDRLNGPLGLTLKFLRDGYGPSDHTPFYAAKAPVLFFFTGPHSDYHKPSDDVEKVNFAGMAHVLDLVERVVDHLAAAPRPRYVALSAPTRRQSGGGGRRGYGPRFGIIPDFSEFEGGVLISGVRPGSPAASVGLRKGDVITKFAGVPVYNLYDFTYVLRSKRAGDKVKVSYRRNEMELTGAARLERRR